MEILNWLYGRKGKDMENDLISRRALFNALFAHNGRLCPNKDIDNFPTTVNVEDVKGAIRNAPTAYYDDIGKIVEKLQTELCLADKEKERCAKENPLQFDAAKGYAHGISVALEIAKSVGVLEASANAVRRG